MDLKRKINGILENTAHRALQIEVIDNSERICDVTKKIKFTLCGLKLTAPITLAIDTIDVLICNLRRRQVVCP